MVIDIDLNKRIEWIKARVVLDSLTEQYVRFQIQEAVVEALEIVQKLSQHDVMKSVCEKCHNNTKYSESQLCKECLLEIYDKQTDR